MAKFVRIGDVRVVRRFHLGNGWSVGIDRDTLCVVIGQSRSNGVITVQKHRLHEVMRLMVSAGLADQFIDCRRELFFDLQTAMETDCDGLGHFAPETGSYLMRDFELVE